MNREIEHYYYIYICVEKKYDIIELGAFYDNNFSFYSKAYIYNTATTIESIFFFQNHSVNYSQCLVLVQQVRIVLKKRQND